MKKYTVIENKDSKYCKGIPYVSKEKFKENESNTIVGKTHLKKYKSRSKEKDLDFISFKNEEYEVKDRIFGFKKGYIQIGDNEFITLKNRVPFLILFLLLLLGLLFCFFGFRKEIPKEETIPQPSHIIIEKEDIIEEPIKEIELPTEKPKVEEPIKEIELPTEKPKDNPVLFLPPELKHNITFNSNGGLGNMEIFECDTKCSLPANEFIKEGYTFIGWSLEATGKVIYEDKAELNDLPDDKTNIPLYAVWSINSYEITFLDFDKTVLKKEDAKYNDKIIFPENPERKGYTFTRWDTDLDIVKDNLIITAVYEINNYDIHYNINRGSIEDAPNSYDIENSVRIPNPIRKGYEFIGWTSKDEENPIKDYEIPKGTIGNIELTANYEALDYNLIYNTNGAKEQPSPIKVKYDSKYGMLPTLTKLGYDFVNWTNIDNKEVSEDTIFNETNDINIYANWNIIAYNINYNVNGGSIEDAPESYDVENSVRIPNPTKEGYIFIGWTINEGDQPIKDYEIPKGTIGNKELVANYEPISYIVSYDANEGVGTISNSIFTYNQTGKLSKNTFTREGYTFIGWSMFKDGKIVYQDESDIYNLSTTDKETITLYAKWEIKKFNVKYYDLFGGLLKEETVNYGNVSEQPKDPFLDGYTFIGWNPSNDVIKEDTIYRAEYSINDYTIRYNLNKGNDDDITELHYTVESEKITLPTPERKGYTFIGWSGTGIREKALSYTIDKGSIGNREYIANWIANNYIISLNPNNGTIDTTDVEITYNSEYGILPEPQRHGYSFDGWYYDNEKIEESTLMNKDFNHELTANWHVINYNISYDLAGGSSSSLKTSYNIETPSFRLSIPSRSGYTFTGWTGSNGSTPQVNVTINSGSTGNLSYTANWMVNTFSISYDLQGGQASGLPSQYTLDTETFTLSHPWKTGYDFTGWTGSNGSTPQKDVTINKGSIGDKSYTANWRKYNANDYNGIYMISTRNNETWEYTLDGFYNVGDTNVHSGNWIVTVSDYCVDIVGTKYPATAFNYQFYIYKANSTSELLATGNASVLGNYQNNAVTKICW